MNVWGITHPGVVREQNQDAFEICVLADGGIVAVVCDGMGGAKAGNIASTLATGTFMDALLQNELPTDDNIRWHMEAAATEANQIVYHRAIQDDHCSGMGTTMVAVVAQNGVAYIINEGDSRCYHIAEQQAVRITRDHSLVEALVERGELTQEQARTHPHKNLITRALGTENQLRVDFYRQTIHPGEYLLLCSDGLSNVVLDEELAQLINREDSLEACCQTLLSLALERGAPDNVTVVLISCELERRD